MNRAYYFLDTSALFKRYIPEAGTDKIDLLFEKDGLFLISNLTVIEMISNLKRLVDVDKKIDHAVFDAVKNEFFKDVADGTLKVEPVSSVNIITSVGLLSKTYISPIDSLQLAMALNLKEIYGDISFVCSDRKLCRMAIQEGITVLNLE